MKPLRECAFARTIVNAICVLSTVMSIMEYISGNSPFRGGTVFDPQTVSMRYTVVANELVVLANTRIRKEEKMASTLNNILADEKQSTFWLTADSTLKFPSFPPEL